MMYIPDRISEVGSKVVMSHIRSKKLDTEQSIAFIHKCASQNDYYIVLCWPLDLRFPPELECTILYGCTIFLNMSEVD